MALKRKTVSLPSGNKGIFVTRLGSSRTNRFAKLLEEKQLISFLLHVLLFHHWLAHCGKLTVVMTSFVLVIDI